MLEDKAVAIKTDQPLSTAATGRHLTPREMTGYFRARGDGLQIPDEIAQHLNTCKTCRPDWELIQQSDPLLRTHEDARVGLIIERVVADEEFRRKSESTTGSTFSTDRVGMIQQFESSLSTVRRTDLDQWVREILSPKELTIEGVLKACAMVQNIKDDRSRYEASKIIAGAFETRIERERSPKNTTTDGSSKPITTETLGRLLSAEEESIDLSRLDIPVPIAAGFVASFPPTLYYSSPALLEEVGGVCHFHRALFDKLIQSFHAILEAPWSPAVDSVRVR